MTTRGKDTSGYLWAEQGESVVGPVAAVAIVGPIEKVYSYRVPPEITGELTVGQRVQVTIGKRGRLRPGFCIGIDEKPWDSTLREVESLIDAQSFLTPDLLELGRWIAQYYACPLGRTLNALVPDAVRRQSGYATLRFVRLIEPIERIESDHKRIGDKQRAVLNHLAADPTKVVELHDLLRDTGASAATVRAMAARKWLTVEEVRRPAPAPNFDVQRSEPDFTLNDDQRAALDRILAVIEAAAFRVMLLHGVSGSGKTEVYIAAMRHVLATGRQVIMLVPEIALTTQLVNRLASRFENVAVIHSGLTGVERSLTWAAIHAGEKKVVIGTRSAVFAPCPNLGLIVVDEEQETSYKNLQAPRFHVRDVAIKRAQQLGIPVLLGSATPSLESWHNCARLAHFERVALPRRVRELPMPEVTIADMNDEYREGEGIPLLSHILISRLGQALSRNEQAVLLLNRRGYANALFCAGCRQRVVCARCNVSMVLHASRNELVCHYCHARQPAPQRCPNPSCGGYMVRSGGGTQRVEERLKLLFPSARVERVDSDTMKDARSYRRIIDDFESRRIDCIIGTQMIAKGLDFPFVSFVGVIGADVPMVAPDFRAAERLFQLVTQVAGRAGRGGVPGEVVVQTLAPDSPSLRFAVRHDYDSFATEELAIRIRTRMPPATRLSRIVIADADEMVAAGAAKDLAIRLQTIVGKSALPAVDVIGPGPCSLARLRGRYRYEILLRAESAEQMQRIITAARVGKALYVKAASVIVDVDPVSLA